MMAKKISEQGEVDIETQLQEIFRMFDRKGFLFNLLLLIIPTVWVFCLLLKIIISSLFSAWVHLTLNFLLRNYSLNI